ncbi:MAG: hypothetical protein STHCBS139747_007607 [Sporothrix thermara]
MADPELITAIAALAISVVALWIAVLQALQQYFASAQGYSQCSEKIIGPWAAFTKRRLLLTQFRFEVRFRVPVIFVAPPNNRRGPVGNNNVATGKQIVYINGSTENYHKTHTWTPEEYDEKCKILKDNNMREAIRTADNELTNWLALLMAIQRMERESREWQARMKRSYTPLSNVALTTGHISEYGDHTMVVGVQEKTRSWDTMPDGLMKPYATTAMCHLVEIMAMLGIHWKEFDRRNNVYRAQGNGFLVTGSMVPNLGVAFTFEKIGKTWFQENRIVPNDTVKQLCFGFCPTIFQADVKTPLYTDEPKDEGTLQLATRAEVAETLVSFGCNTNTVNYFRLGNENTRYAHLFPVTFEMLGMVGQTLQIPNTLFTMLPNPTFFTWNKTAFSLNLLMRGFLHSLEEADKTEKLFHSGSHLAAIRKDLDNIITMATNEDRQRHEDEMRLSEIRRLRLNENAEEPNGGMKKESDPENTGASLGNSFRRILFKLHLTGRNPADDQQPSEARNLAPDTIERRSFSNYLEGLHSAIKRCDEFLSHNDELVQHVFALHMQEVLCYLNSRPDTYKEELHESPVAGSWPTWGGHGGMDSSANDGGGHRAGFGVDGERSHRGSLSHIHTPAPNNTEYFNEQYIKLQEIDTASWASRHHKLMKLYVMFIRRRIARVGIPKKLSTYTYKQTRMPEERTAAMVQQQDSPALSAAGAGTATESLPLPTLSEAADNDIAEGGISAAVNVGVERAQSATTATTLIAAEAAVHEPAEIEDDYSLDESSAPLAGGSPATPTPVTEAPTGHSTTAANAAAQRRNRTNREADTDTRQTTMRDIEDIWCTLVFRMLCWLMLHDFHKKDVQVSKSDVYDSRQAVYLL